MNMLVATLQKWALGPNGHEAISSYTYLIEDHHILKPGGFYAYMA